MYAGRSYGICKKNKGLNFNNGGSKWCAWWWTYNPLRAVAGAVILSRKKGDIDAIHYSIK